MAFNFGSRLQHAWNAFMTRDPTIRENIGVSYGTRPDRPRLTRGNERSLITSIYNRIALDVAQINIEHAQLDENNRYLSTRDSALNNCLSIEANLDQTGRAFIQDAVLSMLDEGCVALVPVDTNIDPRNGGFSVETIRTGKILEWYPMHVKVRVYNEKVGEKQDIIVPKKSTAIIENPFYAVMNESNSTMQRLIHKLNLLDVVDEQSSSGKLDLIIQLPYVIRTEARRNEANRRRKEIEEQLAGSKYGIAYTDGTEKITQLNRSIENNLMKQIEYLTSMLFSQLGITQAILDGTADDKTMKNYYSRIVEPILSAITDEIKRKFLTKTARTQKQSIVFFQDPFKLIPVSEIADIADKFTRNEIMTPNEMRQVVGMKPSNDPKSDELRNRNISQSAAELEGQMEAEPMGEEMEPMSEEPYEDNILDRPLSEIEGLSEMLQEEDQNE